MYVAVTLESNGNYSSLNSTVLSRVLSYLEICSEIIAASVELEHVGGVVHRVRAVPQAGAAARFPSMSES